MRDSSLITLFASVFLDRVRQNCPPIGESHRSEGGPLGFDQYHEPPEVPFNLTGAARLLVDEADAEDAAVVLSERGNAAGKA
jgi:hypothetical protein